MNPILFNGSKSDAWNEQNDTDTPFVAIFLFIDEKYDPGNCKLECVPPCRLIRCNLVDCLDYLGDKAGALSVLKPFAFTEEKKLPEAVEEWKSDIRSLDLSEQKMKNLMDLLIYAILQRFPTLGRKELDKMLELTPLEKTTAVKEIIQITEEKGMEKGMDKGELIGQIHLAQRLMRKPTTPREKLAKQSIEELNALFNVLEPELNKAISGTA